jgi:hypothetical protein
MRRNKFYEKPLSFSGIFFTILLIFFFTNSDAQSACTGTLGTTVVDITFGSGSTNPGPPLPTAVAGAGTTYNYASYATGTPPAVIFDGDYALVNEVPNNSAWYVGATDHTGDANGYMAFFNASPTPGQFYKQNISGLTSGNVYEFAAWIANVINPSVLPTAILPNITFQILDSTTQAVLGTYNTGDIPNSTSMTWKQYSFLFTMPVDITTITLELTNNNIGGTQQPGNDLAIDDITFRPCLATTPVVLKNFTGAVVGKSVVLSWATFDEVNTAADIVQRSYNGFDFTEINSLPAKGSLQQNNYGFTDHPSFSNASVFYRLKLTDKDGKYILSNMLAMRIGSASSAEINLFPNPAKNYMQLTYVSNAAESTTIKITDISGKTIITQRAFTSQGTNSIQINLQNKLQSGTYIIQFILDGKNIVKKFIVD